ncbi:hypothetical protein EXT67_20485 [Pectobacterium atrosepticum]|uniref:Uncharacterized protein n=1 Tax=Pectobacterium phage phiTE TaxID=1116482 RepID=K9L3S3_9CAUD|nr:hypothetical protein [Pectobacterium atrosepticum]YP_007392560.1 hypothetical protein phiTE_098 [Pectobacterium phage phiTE]ARB11618.1 hypothetical protein CB7_144 [Pectobacterium phage vB_PatM_CB7]MCL6409006.1 hypothetical protein [Dickeya dadantii]AEZ66264.1 hypothetical protein phiTE_098 [Pectobacterium phage phiTE]MCL6318684.1 hypothetical protein [Pectobacterium atrosepticum]
MGKEICPKTGVVYPTYGYTQKEIRYLAVDCSLRIFEGTDGTIYLIHDDGPVNPLHPDLSGWYLQILEDYL